MFVLTISRQSMNISRPNSNMGHVRSKTRSSGQILVNILQATFVTGFFLKLDQNVCLDSVYAKFEYES